MEQEIQKIKIKNLSESIGEELTRLIAMGVFEPGARLNEVHLAKSFGVSRGPIREAARELEGAGLVISRPRQGFYVSKLSAKEVDDLYEARGWMDQALIHDFHTYSDAKTCREIAAKIDTIDPSSKATFGQTQFQFRLFMTSRMHNQVIASQAVAIYRKLYTVTALVTVPDVDARMQRIIEVTRAFWTAMEEGDIERAKKIMADDVAFFRMDIAPRFSSEI